MHDANCRHNCAVHVLQGQLAQTVQVQNVTTKRFLDRLFSTLGWSLTEFSVTGTYQPCIKYLQN
jgi:hypothetical protein